MAARRKKKKWPFEAAPRSFQRAHTHLVCPACQAEVLERNCVYSRTSDGDTQVLCWECDAKRPAKEKAEREKAAKVEQFKDLVRAVGRVTAPTVTDLCVNLAEKFGGVKGFADFYHQQTMAAASTASGAGSGRVLNACAAIAKIIAMSTAYQATMPEVSQLTDDDLADEWERGMTDVLKTLPPQEVQRLLENTKTITVTHDAPTAIPG